MKKIVQFRIYEGEKYYVAECVDLPIVTQGKTLDEVAENISRQFPSTWKEKTSRNGIYSLIFPFWSTSNSSHLMSKIKILSGNEIVKIFSRSLRYISQGDLRPHFYS